MKPQNKVRYDSHEKRSIAVLIDCWDFDKFREDMKTKGERVKTNHPPSQYIKQCEQVFHNICDRLDNLELLQAIAFCTYNLKTNHDESYYNGIDLVGDKKEFDDIRKRKGSVDRWELELHKIIRKHNWKCKTYELYTRYQIETLIQKYQPIEDVYILGLTWNECLHKRAVGIKNILKLGKRVLTYQNCTLTPHINVKRELVDVDDYYVDMDNDDSLEKIVTNLYESVI